MLGINIEETEGVNTADNAHDAGGGDRRSGPSWSPPGGADPRIHLREVEWSLRYAGGGAGRHGGRAAAAPARPDPDRRPTTARWCCSRRSWPASPIPATATSAAATCCARRWREILGRRRRHAAGWREFLTGVEACRSACPYFGFCGGGARRQPLLRARAVRRYGDRALPQQQDPPTGGSAGACPRPRVAGSLSASSGTPGSGRRPGARGRGGADRAAPRGRGRATAAGGGAGRRRCQRGLRLEPLREHPDVLQLEQPAHAERTRSAIRGLPTRPDDVPGAARSLIVELRRRCDGHMREHAGSHRVLRCDRRSAGRTDPGVRVVVRVVLVIVVDVLVVVVVEVAGPTCRCRRVRAARRRGRCSGSGTSTPGPPLSAWP